MAAPEVSPALQRLVDRLDALQSHTSETLAGALSGALDFEDVIDHAKFDRHNYRRNLVLRRPAYELRALCWMPGQRTSLHGHNGAACAFRIMTGTSTEIRLGSPDNRWTPGDVVEERGAGQVHQITNLGDVPLVSLNAYAPALPFDQPPATYEGRHIVIIGGGASGAALAIQLLTYASREIKITIVEERQWLGRGPAYGTTDPAFRLNVPAERMSLFPDRPNDFIEWARAQGTVAPAGALLPRRLFGEYVEDRLAAAISSSHGKVWLYRSSAISATEEGVLVADGAFLPADAVVLATGNQLPAAPDAIPNEILRSPRVIGDPWTDGALAAVPRDEAVLVVGTGLTTVDVLHTLRRNGHRGEMVAISRRGLLPRAHLGDGDPRSVPVTIDPANLPTTARELSRYVRMEARRLESEGIAWQCLVDAVRPHTGTIWSRLPTIEKARFMRKLRPFWEVVCHRAERESLETLAAWSRAGRFELLSASVAAVTADQHGLDVALALRDGRTRQQRFSRIVLCTGPQTDVTRWRGLLFRNLLRAGQLTPDALGLGIVNDAEGRVVDAEGTPSAWLSTLGSLRRARLWETTAVPDLVKQAAELARRLLTRS